jgi:DNA-binding beta-propeller fold protein YncE
MIKGKILKAGMLLVVGLLLLACSSKVTKPDEGETLIVYPPPPDTTRIQFLTGFSTSTEIVGKRSSFKTYVMGKEEEKSILKPYGFAIADGKIYICDTILGGLEVIDLDKKTFDYFQPAGLGQLKKPINCFVDEEGRLYVADSERQQVVIFDKQGKYLHSIGGGELEKPTDVTVYDNKIWISDIKNHKVLVYSRETYEVIFSLPDAPPDTPGFLFSPTNLYVSDNKVYVSDFGDFRIKIYRASDGEFLGSVGSYGNKLGQFVRPKGIAVDRNANLYVVDAGFENVQLFNPEGKLLMFFGGNTKAPGGMWLPAKVVLDYDHLDLFRKYVHDSFELQYLIFVVNQYGPAKINVYGFVNPR